MERLFGKPRQSHIESKELERVYKITSPLTQIYQAVPIPIEINPTLFRNFTIQPNNTFRCYQTLFYSKRGSFFDRNNLEKKFATILIFKIIHPET